MKENRQWVLAAEFSGEPDAFIAKGMLENAGIAAYVEPNNMSTLYGAGTTWAPVRLFVGADDLSRARELLRRSNDA